MTDDNTSMVDTAKQALARDKQERVKAFHDEYIKLAEKYRCDWMAEIKPVNIQGNVWGFAPELKIIVYD